MRYKTLLVVASLTVTIPTIALAPSPADARRGFGPGAVLGLVTAPMRMLAARGHSRHAHRHRSHRTYAAGRRGRPEPASHTPANAPAGVAAGITGATAAATAATTAPTPAAAAMPAPAGFNAYEDMLGYALWPDDYADAFWSHGYKDIARSLIAPPAGPRNNSPEAAKGAAAGEPASMCLSQVKERATAPLDRLEKTLALSDAQRPKLKDLRAAVETAVDRGQSACRDAPPATPADQLKVMMDGLWAIRDAGILLRTPLDGLYRSLTDEQKAKLTPNATTTGGPAAANQVCEHAANEMPVGDLTRSMQPAQRQRQQQKQPSQQQRQSMEMLQGMVADLSKYLAEACPAETPSSPVARLDAAGNRVNAMLYAAMNLDPILNGSYQEQGGPK